MAEFFLKLPSLKPDELNYSRWISLCMVETGHRKADRTVGVNCFVFSLYCRLILSGFVVCVFFSELNLYLLFSSNPSLSQLSTEDQDAVFSDENDDIHEDIESTPEPEIDQADSHSQRQEASPEPEMGEYDSSSQNTECSQGSGEDQNDSNSHQETESTPETEIDQLDSISQDTESAQGSEMEQNDSSSHLGKEPEPEVNQDNETFTSAF